MILYVNGDSNSSGHELKNQNLSWPKLLSTYYNFRLINQSKAGTSNPRILRVTKDFIKQNYNNIQEYFIIIGWTSWEREEWLYNGIYYDVNAGGHDVLPPELKDRYKDWVVEQNEDMRKYKSAELQEKIFKLHEELCSLKVKHLFFNGLMPFLHDTAVGWGKNYLEPYNNNLSYYWYLNRAGFVPTKNNHHLEDAQVAWADVLKNYIENNNLL